jgi:hypothetical protein
MDRVQLEDEYIAWMRWAGDTNHRHLALCDSDSPGAFKVYRSKQWAEDVIETRRNSKGIHGS